MSDRKNKIRIVQCEMALAKYWGTCGETIMNAVEMIKKNPNMDVAKALKIRFEKSIEKLMPFSA